MKVAWRFTARTWLTESRPVREVRKNRCLSQFSVSVFVSFVSFLYCGFSVLLSAVLTRASPS
jgi:hypothetical protein